MISFVIEFYCLGSVKIGKESGFKGFFLPKNTKKIKDQRGVK